MERRVKISTFKIVPYNITSAGTYRDYSYRNRSRTVPFLLFDQTHERRGVILLEFINRVQALDVAIPEISISRPSCWALTSRCRSVKVGQLPLEKSVFVGAGLFERCCLRLSDYPDPIASVKQAGE